MNLSITVEPSVAVVELLALLQEELDEPIRQLGADVTWGAPERIRILLAQLDDFEPALLPRLRDIIRTVAKTEREFELGLLGTELLPSEELPRFVMVGVGEGRAHVEKLQRKLDAGLDSLGLAKPNREPRLGALVGRIKSAGARPNLRGLANAFADTDYGTTRVRELVIAESKLRPGHTAQHRVLHRYALGTGG